MITTRSEFVTALVRKCVASMPSAISGAKGTAYRINMRDTPMNCRTCTAHTTGRVTLASGEPMVRCIECFQRIGYDDPLGRERIGL